QDSLTSSFRCGETFDTAPYNRYTSRFDTTDAVTFDTTDTLPLNTHRASLHQLLVRFAGSTM
ncbi:hypothetical protein, partial [uncultured Porphyromonas sp.]|uniref:hypothetical protein n=1 Tax=uncultured Porphyromonas sp. TaxID=159274 RepID=UPI002804298F